MKKTKFLSPILAALLLSACNQAGNQQNNESTQQTGTESMDMQSMMNDSSMDAGTADSSMQESLADMHTSENALDWAGTYEGTLPCADCPGIKLTLTVNANKTYALQQEYLERDVKNAEQGSFSWDEKGSIITLKNEAGREDMYQVGENELYRLDPDGNRITGEMADLYTLKKQ